MAGHAVFSWLDDGGPVPVAVQVTPAQSLSTGQTVTLTAKVIDQDGNGMAGRTVTFDRRGVNQGTSTAFTDAAGNASITYTGTGGVGADVVTASTPSLAGTTVSGVGTVAWTGVPTVAGTAIEFVPPGAHAPSGTATLSFRAVNLATLPGFGGTVRYWVGPVGQTPPGTFTATATADHAGLGTITVTTAATEVAVFAFADRVSSGTSGSRDTDEALGVAVVTTRAVPRGTVVAFVPPFGTAPVGGNVQLPFTATYNDGTTFSGDVRWCAVPATSTSTSSTSCVASGFVTTGPAGNGTVTVTPTTTSPTLRVTAYADGLTLGTQDTTELTGAALALGTAPPPPVTTTSVPLPTTTSTTLPSVTTTSVPLPTTTSTTLPSVTTTSVPLPTTTSTSLPPVTTTSVPVTTTSTSLPNSPPGTPTLVDPPSGKAFAATEPQIFTVNASDPNGDPYTGTIEVTNTSTGQQTTFPTSVSPSGNISSTAAVPPLPAGSYSWRARATDVRLANGAWSLSRSFTVSGPTLPPVTTTTTSLPPVTTTSTSLPTVTTTTLPANGTPFAPTLVSPADSEAFATTTEPPTFTVNAVDPEGDPYTGTVQVAPSSTGFAPCSTTTPPPAGATVCFTTTAAVSGSESQGVPTTPLAQGSYLWRARATDARDTGGPWSTPRTFSVGNQAPLVPTLLSPAPGAVLSADDPQLFTLVSNDVEGDPYTATVTIRTPGGSTVGAPFTTSVALSGHHSQGIPVPQLAPGDYTWEAVARDAKGAASVTTARRPFSVVLNRPPAVPTLISPDPGRVLYMDDRQAFTIASEDPNGDVWNGTVTVKNSSGVVVDSFPTSPARSGEYSTGVPTKPLGSGDYKWSATAKDVSGAGGTTPSPERSFTISSKSGTPPVALPSDIPMTRASVSALKEQADGISHAPAISADGRFVAFESDASNLVPGDTNTHRDIFVHDRLTGVTERVSVSDSEAQASASGWFESFDPSISANGRYVAFISSATNLVPADTNSRQDVFVRDREAGTTVRVNLSSSGAQATGSVYEADISGDGRHVAFASDATNLVTGDTNALTDVFVRDIDTNFTERVSTKYGAPTTQVTGGTFGSRDPSISADGRFVAFESDSNTFLSIGNPDDPLDDQDANGTWDVFVHDRNSSWGTVRVSTSAPFWGDTAGPSRNPEVSQGGHYVVFESMSTDMVSGDSDTNGTWDVFRFRYSDSSMARVSFNSSGAQGNGPSTFPTISPEGRYVALQSGATNLVAGDRNGVTDIFLRDMTASTTTMVSHDPDGHLANNRSERPSVASDAMHVVFTSLATNLVTADTNRGVDVFAYNRHRSLTCVAGALSAVGCLSGYGFKASSDRMGLESFYAYHAFDMGSDTGYLNVSNGNLVVQGTDLEVPGRGLNMRLTHTYNSHKDQGDGALGRGWRVGVADGESEDLLGAVVSAVLSADVGQILEVVVTEDQFDFHDADGTRHHFVKGGLDGPGWHSPPGVDLKLSDYLVGTERRYKATRPDGVFYEFRPLGGPGAYLLSTVRDRNGNTLTFSYSSGALSSITDAAGRSITFAWSGQYLDSATYNLTTVDYTVTNGRLDSISVGGRTTSYTYDSEGLRTVSDGRGNTTTLSISGGMLTQVTDRAGKAWRIAYNTSACQPGDPRAAVATCITDPDPAEPTTGAAHTEVYTSSAEGNLLVRRDAGDPATRQRSWVWEGNRVTSETDEGGTTTDYAYNDNGQVVLTRQSGGDGSEPRTTVLLYRDVSPGVADLLEARVGAGSSDERVWRFGRSEEGNLTSTTAPDGTVTRFTHLPGGLLSSVTDPRGKVTTYGNHHASGQPQLVTDPTSASRTMAYDGFGRPTSVVDRTGQTWTIGYDARGNVTSRATPSGTATFGYDLNDNQTSATPPGGATVTRVYDPRDLLSETRATVDGIVRKSTYAYFDDGQLKEVNGPRTFAGTPTVAQKVQFRRFPNNRVSAAVDEHGAVTEFTYTPEGHVRTVTAPPGATASRSTTTFAYNRRGQTTSVTEWGSPEPRTTTNVYNLHGELLSTKTPTGRTTSFAYDKLGRLLRTVDPAGRQSTRTYDVVGNLVALTQPEGQGGSLTTTYTYTARNEIASESDPADGSHTVEYTYDGEGRQRFRYDRYDGAVERTVEQAYRADGALLSTTATGATGSGFTDHSSTYGYDTAGNMTSATATVGGATVSSLTLGYNEAFELETWSETVYDSAGVGRTKTGTYAHQPDGLLSSRTVDGLATTYGYSPGGREVTVTPWGGLGSFQHQYFPNGLLEKTTLPNSVEMEQLFDPADRLVTRIYTRPDLSLVASWKGITYDDDGNRMNEAVAQAQPAGSLEPVKSGVAKHAYDSLGRLISARHPFEPDTAHFTLDDGGNVVKDPETTFTYVKNRLTRRAGTDVEHYDNGDNTETAFTSTYTHDRLGNQKSEATSSTATSTVRDQTGQLQTQTGSATVTRTYSYDAASHPTRVASSDGSWVDYAYDALGRLARRVEHPVSGSDVVTLFFHDGVADQLALETDGGGNVQARYILDSGGEPVGQHRGSRSYYLDDPRGNLSVQLDGARNVVAVYNYDAYGEEKKGLTKAPAAWASRLRYQMAPRDPVTGAYNLGGRLMDPGINRFVGADSFVAAAAGMDLALDPLTGNRYLYAGANPAGLIDDGHGWFDGLKRGAKVIARFGKGMLRNPWVRGGAVVGICLATSGWGCFIAGVALSGANYLVNSKTLSLAGFAKTVGVEGATAALGGKVAAAAAKRAAAMFRAAATRAGQQLAARRAGDAAARVVDDVAGAGAKVHGNSRQSPTLTYLYRLETKAGEYLLTGITSNPSGRYSQAFMKGKTMRFLTQGSRSDMLDYERVIVEVDPGPVNFEPWAGAGT